MSDTIKHECGIALIRLLKPLDYYYDKYGTPFYGINKMQLLMQKQRNRGQDGAGLATIKLDTEPGIQFIDRHRTIGPQYLKELFDDVFQQFHKVPDDKIIQTDWLKKHVPFTGELIMGHLRYGTHGTNNIESCHPILRINNWISRNLILAGNFNLTNVDEMFNELIDLGQFPKEKSDTVTVLEKIGHFLDVEVQYLFDHFKLNGMNNKEITASIVDSIDISRILSRASRKFDGGYVMAGMIGHGDAFVMRDPSGIRPAFYYSDDEVVVVASERPAIMTAMNKRFNSIREIQRGHALVPCLVIKKNGQVKEVPFIEKRPLKACSFERIYFSRGSDRDIYMERKRLGELLAEPVMEAVNENFSNTVFTYVPNTAESAFYGFMYGIEKILNEVKTRQILALEKDATPDLIENILNQRARFEKLVIKDEKLRTFIADDASRDEMVAHVYDVTYGIVQNEVDTLVLLDDSIVRGTTLRDSIITIVSRLLPKKIIVVSSAPQIRYPDCYGIDMSKMGEFVAFQALIALIEEQGKEYLLEEAYEKCKAQQFMPKEEIKNEVKPLYDLFEYEEISAKIAEIVTPKGVLPKVEIIFQTVENLREACPGTGDWYFSGDYPTPGGNKVVNKAFMNFMEKLQVRAY
jgi:amidophosphoribosyltransferase